jgi:hypothetical protein
MAMQASNLVRPLLVSVALTVAAGSAIAQSTEKDRSTTARQSSTKSSAAKPAAATKRLDFVPSSSVKDTASTRSPGGQAAPAPAKQESHCDHSLASDA